MGTCILRTLCNDKDGSQEVISGLWPRNRKLIKPTAILEFGISNSSNIYHIFHVHFPFTTGQSQPSLPIPDVFFCWLALQATPKSDRLCVEGFWILCVRCVGKWVGKGVKAACGSVFVHFFRLNQLFYCQQNCRRWRWKKILLMDNIFLFFPSGVGFLFMESTEYMKRLNKYDPQLSLQRFACRNYTPY